MIDAEKGLKKRVKQKRYKRERICRSNTLAYYNVNRAVSYSQLPLSTMTIDSFLEYEPRLNVKYS